MSVPAAPGRVDAGWADTLDAFEAVLADAETELARLATAGHAPLSPGLRRAAPGSQVGLTPVPLASLPATSAAAVIERATALATRQAEVMCRLRRALALLRRHLDVLDTVAEPPARPHFVDQLS